MPMVNQEAAGWNYTSTVVTDPKQSNMPCSKAGQRVQETAGRVGIRKLKTLPIWLTSLESF